MTQFENLRERKNHLAVSNLTTFAILHIDGNYFIIQRTFLLLTVLSSKKRAHLLM